MSVNDDLERRIADFYETEAPPAAPDWVLRDALATIVGYVLLIAVLSIAVAALVLTMEKGVVDLTRRVSQLLAFRP